MLLTGKGILTRFFTILTINLYYKWNVAQAEEDCFSTYWNVPSESCTGTLGYPLPLSSYGIKSNDRQAFHGSVLNIFYINDGKWPYLRKSGNEVVVHNGGIPQEGDLEAHLKLFRDRVNEYIPDPQYDGLAIIDFEDYIPDLNIIQGGLRGEYQDRSLAFARKENPGIQNLQVLKTLSANLFNSHTRRFMEETLKAGISMRPNGKWGYYGYPYCYRAELDKMECALNQIRMNDANMWLYETSTALFPGIYLHKHNLPSDVDTGIWIRKVVDETRRVQVNLRSGPPTPAYMYARFEYPADPTHKDERFLSKADLLFSYKIPMDMGMAGIVIWGSSTRISSKCRALDTYLRDTMQPIIQKSERFCRGCRSKLCNDVQEGRKSRCVLKNNSGMEYIYGIYNSSQIDPIGTGKQETCAHYFCDTTTKN